MSRTRHRRPPSLADGTCVYHQARADTLLDEVLTGPLREHLPVRPRRAPAEGPAHKILLERTAAADLVVVGAHRHEHTRGLQLGRGAHTLLHHALCPFAVVPKVEGNTRA
ncbi:universal stress protein [Streptomyces sp. NPDC004050]